MSRRKGFTIVYDSEGLAGFETGWGFSALVTDQHRVLFDCGWDGSMLLRNLSRLHIPLAEIQRIVLSHAHWDHLSGLATILREHPEPFEVEVFVPASFSPRLKEEISRNAVVREVGGPLEVVQNVFTTGELGKDPEEQALLLVDGNDCVVLTGCAHPGIGLIAERACRVATPRWLVGGLHDATPHDIPASVDRILMCHCTKHRGPIAAAFGDAASIGGVGRSFYLANHKLVETSVDAP